MNDATVVLGDLPIDRQPASICLKSHSLPRNALFESTLAKPDFRNFLRCSMRLS
jgi:hypothetical protein